MEKYSSIMRSLNICNSLTKSRIIILIIEREMSFGFLLLHYMGLYYMNIFVRGLFPMLDDYVA